MRAHPIHVGLEGHLVRDLGDQDLDVGLRDRKVAVLDEGRGHQVDLVLEPYVWTYWNKDFGWGNRVGDMGILGNPAAGTYLPDDDLPAALAQPVEVAR